MTEYLPSEKGVPIRYPSVANLMVDSADRNVNVYPSPYDFQITRPNSLLNGFFTRVGTTEVVLEWCEPNISLANNTLVIDVSGIGAETFVGTLNFTATPGFYSVAQLLQGSVLPQMQTLVMGTTIVFVWGQTTSGQGLGTGNAVLTFGNTRLAQQLGIAGQTSTIIPNNQSFLPMSCPDLRPYRYIDFVSSQLTYCQDVKDASTAPLVRDVLCRYYFSYDTENNLDAYGFPILMGYTRFCIRRIFNPPKQIKWDNNLPVGNLSFEVYGDDGGLIPYNGEDTEWLMTLQISEV
jgi:hypothetical protein